MYWSIQEKFIFSIIFIFFFLIQITSIHLIKAYSSIAIILLIVILNLLAFFGMVYYTKWVWKFKTFISVLKKVIMYEVVLILLFIIFWLIIKFR